MELERKIKLLKKSYMFGYAAEAAWINWVFPNFQENFDQINLEHELPNVYKNFENIQRHYDKVVPFYEISREMEARDWDDFAVLFRVRDFLPKFREFLDDYVYFLRDNNYYAPRGSEIDKRREDIWAELFDAESYQGMTLKDRMMKYDADFLQKPAPSQK